MLKLIPCLIIAIMVAGISSAETVDKITRQSDDSAPVIMDDSAQVIMSEKQLATWMLVQGQRNDVYAREIYVLRKEMHILYETIGVMAAQISIAGDDSELAMRILKFQKEKHDAFVKDFFDRADKWGDSDGLEIYKVLRDSPYSD